MGKGRSVFERFADASELTLEAMPGQPIVELVGDRRVLIENHQGVKAYGREKILVKVRFGYVCVCGCGLELLCMTRAQLVIRGRIDSVALQRRGEG